MLRKSLATESLPMSILPLDKRKCKWIAYSVIIQCVVVFVGSVTILECLWYPNKSSNDYNKLVRIMYLYDYDACGYRLRSSSALANIRLPNETHGLSVLPIRWEQALLTVSTRLSSKTRVYIDSSLAVHVVWITIAIIMGSIVRKSSKHPKLFSFTLTVFFYCSVCVIIFDISMAFVYVGHIQQSVTKGMVLRYSGWSVELKLQNYDDFAGWIPMAASVCWMRGIIILIWNIYSCRYMNKIRRKIKKRDIKRKLMVDVYRPIPDPERDLPNENHVLYYRRGEHKPTAKDEFLARVFFN